MHIQVRWRWGDSNVPSQQRKPKPSPPGGYVPLATKPGKCSGCPAYKTGRSFVPPVGPSTAKLAILGQGPGEMEAYQAIPFVGPSGKHLDTWLYKAGVPRQKVWIGNIVQCWLPGNRAPRAKEVAYCRKAHWGPVLEKLEQLKVIVPVGVPAMNALLPYQCNETNAGDVVWIE